jgi:transcriptional antiterminator NusG
MPDVVMPEDNVTPQEAVAPAPPEAPAAPPLPDVVAEAREETPAGEAVDDEKPAAAEADEEISEEEVAALGAPPEAPAVEPSTKHWYVVKVQSGREESIKEAIERRVKIERVEEFFGQIVIPVERVTELRKGKRVVKERKLYPGYLMAEVELVDPEGRLNDRILYLFRETSGVGDFVGGTPNRPPPPMSQREVDKMIGHKRGAEGGAEKVIVAKPQFSLGERVKVRDGTFAGMEGEVKEILEALQHVRVELTIFGRPVPVELEYWQVEGV